MGSMLFNTSAYDPLTLGTITLLLAAVALVACFFPGESRHESEPNRSVARRMIAVARVVLGCTASHAVWRLADSLCPRTKFAIEASQHASARSRIHSDSMTDLRYAFRQLIKSPSFSATAIFALALGIGATTAMFAVIYAFLLRPLPYADPEKLVMLQSRSTRSGSDLGVNYLDFVDWQKQSRSFSDHRLFQSALERKSRAGRRHDRDPQDHLHDGESFQSARRAAGTGPQSHRR